MSYTLPEFLAHAVAEVERLATEFASEEAEHVASLEKWLALTPRPSATFQADPEIC